jgi:hypothetical protein
MEQTFKLIGERAECPNGSLIVRNIQSPLSNIPFHKDVKGIERMFAQGFPLHLAIHDVQNIKVPPDPYTQLHTHDFEEINILIGDDLNYHIQLDNERYELKGSYSIWIPAGTPHAANVVGGRGYFIAIRLAPAK